jgi:RNA-directed DNA polymerase
MKVPYDEGLASHIGPESCAGDREGAGEALTGESAGRVLSRESRYASGCRRCHQTRKAARCVPLTRGMDWPCVVEDPAHAWKLSAREPGGPTPAPGKWPWGTRHESERSTMAMNGRGKSDRPIGTVETFEQRQVRILLTEEVEGRGLTKGNPFWQNRRRTQDRARGQYGEP